MIELRSGKMPTTSVRLRSSRFNRSWGFELHVWRQISRGNAVNASRSSPIVGEVLADDGQLRLQRAHDSVELGVHLGGVGLVDDGADQGGHPRLRG